MDLDAFSLMGVTSRLKRKDCDMHAGSWAMTSCAKAGGAGQDPHQLEQVCEVWHSTLHPLTNGLTSAELLPHLEIVVVRPFPSLEMRQIVAWWESVSW